MTAENLSLFFDQYANDRHFRAKLRSDLEAALRERGLADDEMVRSAVKCIDFSRPDEVLSDQLLHARVTK